jgi:hypothetical protein
MSLQLWHTRVSGQIRDKHVTNFRTNDTQQVWNVVTKLQAERASFSVTDIPCYRYPLLQMSPATDIPCYRHPLLQISPVTDIPCYRYPLLQISPATDIPCYRYPLLRKVQTASTHKLLLFLLSRTLNEILQFLRLTARRGAVYWSLSWL